MRGSLGRVRSADAAHLLPSPRRLKMGRPDSFWVLLGLSRLGSAALCARLDTSHHHTRPAGLSEQRTPELQVRSDSFRVSVQFLQHQVHVT